MGSKRCGKDMVNRFEDGTVGPELRGRDFLNWTSSVGRNSLHEQFGEAIRGNEVAPNCSFDFDSGFVVV